MPKPIVRARFAVAPFKLIETPVHAQKATAPYDGYVEAASIMTLSHNVIIRGLNSIYLQASYIQAEETNNFIAYAKCWCEVLEAHHTMEETVLFPEIASKTGEQGIMMVNVEEHHMFLPGLNRFSNYLAAVSTRSEPFSGSHLNSLIDSFAPMLVTHLTHEIDTLLSLSKFGSKLPLLDMINREAMKSPMHVSKTGGTPFFFRNLDVEFEGGLWEKWPMMPGLVWWIMQRTFVAWNEKWWKFSSCDSSGKLRDLSNR